MLLLVIMILAKTKHNNNENITKEGEEDCPPGLYSHIR